MVVSANLPSHLSTWERTQMMCGKYLIKQKEISGTMFKSILSNKSWEQTKTIVPTPDWAVPSRYWKIKRVGITFFSNHNK